MAVGLSGWAHNRATRDGRGSRVQSHAEVQQAETALLAQQAALRAALTGAAEDLEAVLATMAQAEDALLAARQAYTAATAAPAEAPVWAPRVSVAVERQVRRARRVSAPRPSFTYGSWV
jgi:multidrug resistance efflux pump